MTQYLEEENDEGDEVDDFNGEGMSFLEHLEDFRWTVARSLFAFILGVVLATCFIGDIAQLLKFPIIHAYGSAELADANLITYRCYVPHVSPRSYFLSRGYCLRFF